MLKRLFLPALAWLALGAGASPTGAAAVEVRMAPDGVHALVSLDRPVTRFAFAEADVGRAGDFELLTPGLTLRGDEVTAAKPFRRFELRVRPMTRERNAKYPPISGSARAAFSTPRRWPAIPPGAPASISGSQPERSGCPRPATSTTASSLSARPPSSPKRRT